MLLTCLEHQDVADFEVVVVLDGDIDGSGGFLAARTSSIAVRTVTFQENRGRSAALNAGMHRGRTVGVVGGYEESFRACTA